MDKNFKEVIIFKGKIANIKIISGGEKLFKTEEFTFHLVSLNQPLHKSYASLVSASVSFTQILCKCTNYWIPPNIYPWSFCLTNTNNNVVFPQPNIPATVSTPHHRSECAWWSWHINSDFLYTYQTIRTPTGANPTI